MQKYKLLLASLAGSLVMSAGVAQAQTTDDTSTGLEELDVDQNGSVSLMEAISTAENRRAIRATVREYRASCEDGGDTQACADVEAFEETRAEAKEAREAQRAERQAQAEVIKDLKETCGAGDTDACETLETEKEALREAREARFEEKCATLGEEACAEKRTAREERMAEREVKRAENEALRTACNDEGDEASCDTLEDNRTERRAASKDRHQNRRGNRGSPSTQETQ